MTPQKTAVFGELPLPGHEDLTLSSRHILGPDQSSGRGNEGVMTEKKLPLRSLGWNLPAF